MHCLIVLFEISNRESLISSLFANCYDKQYNVLNGWGTSVIVLNYSFRRRGYFFVKQFKQLKQIEIMVLTKPKRPRFNNTAVMVGSSNIVRVSLAKRFNIIVRYKEEIFSITHSTLTFNRHE